MKITYTIQVCNESRELYSLINFLLKVKDPEDNVNVTVDSLHTTEKVKQVTDYFKDSITVFERPFDQFHINATFTMQQATGDYIFGLDADEMPQEALIKGLKKILLESDVDVLWIPRINIHPGSTQEFTKWLGLPINENGWINWPDYQGRIWKNNGKVKWTDELHTKLVGGEKVAQLTPSPLLALWHIKAIEKQESRWDASKSIASPSLTNLYDLLM